MHLKHVITPAMARAAIIANQDGVGVDTISGIMGCNAYALRKELRRLGHAIVSAEGTSTTHKYRSVAARHRPQLKAAAQPKPKGADRVCAAEAASLAAEMGIQAYIRPDGISVPYIPSIHGEVRA